MARKGIQGTKDRVERVKQRKTGQWSTVSSDLLFLASRIYKLSEKEAQSSKDGKSSKMVFAGIPLLLSSLTSLIIECESIGVVTAPAVEPLEPLPEVLSTRYRLSGELLKDFECLCEIRNEIVHPVPLPTGTSDNWPEYLRRVKNMKVTIEHPEPNVHYTFFAQMASHDLFSWSLYVTYHAYQAVIHSFPERGGILQLFLTTFTNFAPEPPSVENK